MSDFSETFVDAFLIGVYCGFWGFVYIPALLSGDRVDDLGMRDGTTPDRPSNVF